MTNSQLLNRNDLTATAPSIPDAGVGRKGRSRSLPIIDAVTVRSEEPIGRAIRLLCGMLLVMALLDVPVAVEPGTTKWLGALLLAGVIGTLAALAWWRRRTEDPRGRTTRGRQKGNLVATATR